MQRLAVPTNFTKMALWTLGQNNDFFVKPKRNAISGILMDELSITPVQGRKIIEQRETIKSICGNIKQALSLLTTLKALCEHKQSVFKARMTKCREILTPLQVCKLLIWIDDNWGLLDQVCPGWGAEQRVKNKSIEVEESSSVNAKDPSAPDNGTNFEEEMVKLQEIAAGDESDDSSAAS